MGSSGIGQLSNNSDESFIGLSIVGSKNVWSQRSGRGGTMFISQLNNFYFTNKSGFWTKLPI
ncbi:MAG TPA: hypothetical protein VK211_13075 [Kamptonema sp.]|nr:hypothetical protein [Kamptonema sp.]